MLVQIETQSWQTCRNADEESDNSKFGCPPLILQTRHFSEQECVGRTDSAQDASSYVSAVTQPVLYEFDVFQVIFNDADQMT